MILKKYFSLSKVSVYLIALIWILSFFNLKQYEENVIGNDVISYYGYLPAFFIFENAHLNFEATHKDLFKEGFFNNKYWPEVAPNGEKVIKMTMGLSMLYAPFFFLGHWTAIIQGGPALGYSTPYYFFLILSCFFYLIIGFYFLRKLLLNYYSESVTSLALFSVYLGTNLYFYTTTEPLMSHAYLFSLLCVFLFFSKKWHENPNLKNTLIVGFIGGLMTIIRPTSILLMLIPLLYNVRDKTSLNDKIQLLIKEKFKIVLLLITFVLPILPQLFYWKYITGNWLFYSYVGEPFYFSKPHLIDALFGYRHGLLVYTPIMSFALVGFLFLKKAAGDFFASVTISFLILLYVIFSWWCWWYGGAYGMRALIDLYGLLALPMGAFYQYIFQKGRAMQAVLIFLIFLMIGLNLFQTIQFRRGLIHYDSNTKESFWMHFGTLNRNKEWVKLLKAPNYENAKKGLPEN